MVGHVDDGRLIGGSAHLDVNGVILGKCIDHLCCNCARIAIVAIGGHEGELQFGAVYLIGLIDFILPAGGTAVKGVRTIVNGELISGVAKSKATMVNTVGIAADGGTKIALIVLRIVAGHIVEAKHYIAQGVLLVRHHDGDDTASIVGDTYLHALAVS